MVIDIYIPDQKTQRTKKKEKFSVVSGVNRRRDAF